MAPDQHGNAWFLQLDGVARQAVVQPPGALFAVTKAKPTGLRSGNWDSLMADDLGYLWVTGKDGIERFDPRKPDAGWTTFPKGAGDVTAMRLSPKGLAMVGLSNGQILELDMSSKGEPSTRQFKVQGLPNAPIRAIHTDREGRVWVVAGGGIYRAEAPPDAWQKSWKPLARMPFGNHDIFGAVLDGKLYTAGGIANHGYPAKFTYFSDIFCYDPKEDNWSIPAKMSATRCYAAVAALDGRLWILGGGVDDKGKRVPTDLVEIFDPKTGKVERGPALTSKRMECFAATVGGRLYVIGGVDEKETPLSSVESIAPGETQWRKEPDAPVPMRQFSGCVLDDRIYVIVGDKGLYAYDPAQKKWEADLPQMPVTAPRAAITAAHNGEVWVMGGWTPQVARGTGKVFAFSPKSKTWREERELPGPLAWAAAGDVDGKLIVAGGAYYSPEHAYYIFEDRAFLLRDQQP